MLTKHKYSLSDCRGSCKYTPVDFPISGTNAGEGILRNMRSEKCPVIWYDHVVVIYCNVLFLCVIVRLVSLIYLICTV